MTSQFMNQLYSGDLFIRRKKRANFYSVLRIKQNNKYYKIVYLKQHYITDIEKNLLNR